MVMRYRLFTSKRLLAVMISLAMLAGALPGLAKPAKITASSANLRAQSKVSSKSQAKLKRGAIVEVIKKTGKWSYVAYSGGFGYIRSDLLGSVKGKTKGFKTSKLGAKNNFVKDTQLRLKALGYYTGGTGGKLNAATQKAIKAFQKKHKLKANGVLNIATYKKLISGEAKLAVTPKPAAKPAPSSKATAAPKATPTEKPSSKVSYTDLKYGMKNDPAVKRMQQRLKDLGFFTGEPAGNYLTLTADAVAAFQKRAKLKVNGKLANVAMQKKLFSDEAPLPPATPTPKPTPQPTLPPRTGQAAGVSGDRLTMEDLKQAAGVNAVKLPGKGSVTMPTWSEVKSILRDGTVLTVYDLGTKLKYQYAVRSRGNHADGEPLTRLDTAIQFRTFGYKNTWTPRPVWVELPNGDVYAASIHDMPHSPEMGRDNGFPGHECLHFYGSSTHNGNASYTAQHQNTVKKAWAQAGH